MVLVLDVSTDVGRLMLGIYGRVVVIITRVKMYILMSQLVASRYYDLDCVHCATWPQLAVLPSSVYSSCHHAQRL